MREVVNLDRQLSMRMVEDEIGIYKIVAYSIIIENLAM